MSAPPSMTRSRVRSSERISSPAITGGVIAALLFAAFLALAWAQRVSATSHFDSALVNAIHGWRSDVLTPWVIGATGLGAFTWVVPIAAIVVVVALVRRRWQAAVFLVVVVAVGYFWGTVAQDLIRRTRPLQVQALIPVPAAFSFPSGHSYTSTLLYGAIAFFIWRVAPRLWQRIVGVVLCGFLIVVIGLSRVYLGVHWPTDVIGGWLIGGAWLALLAGAYVTWQRFEATRNVSAEDAARGGREDAG